MERRCPIRRAPIRVYAGLLFAVGFAVYVTVRTGAGLGVLVGVAGWLTFWLLSALALKRRWGERPDAEDYPLPTLRRMWSRTTDRLLSQLMWVSVAAAFVLAVGLVTRSDRTLSTVFALAVSIGFAGTAWAERKLS